MLRFIELERIAEALREIFVGGRIERWVEPERGRLAFSIYRRNESAPTKGVLEIDVRPERAFLGLAARMPRAPSKMPAFAAYLRAHLSRARLEAARIRGSDRQLALEFSAREGRFVLLLSILGRRSNLYLLDGEDRLLRALRPLDETRNELTLGERYRDPAGAAPNEAEDRFASWAGMSLLEAVGESYAEAGRERDSDDDRRRLLAGLRKERKSALRRLERIEAELAEADEVGTLQRNGELLKAHLGRIESGAASVRVEDFETGEPVEIPLDPKKSPKANLEAVFKRYQKLLRRLTKAGGQIEGARASVEEVEGLIAQAEAASEESTIAELMELPFVVRVLGRQAAKMPASKENRETRPSVPNAYRNLPRKLHPRRYRSAAGLEIWVGRSDEANDVLSTRIARGKDLFFHLDGAPGSHVILRAEGRDDPPPEAILDACELAVHFSKQKNAGRADVHVVPIKNVKKPKGAKRGLVYVTGGKSISLRREPQRLERLLADRIDD